jgi:chloramphenicol 3-O-phosphotransferase
MEMSMMNAGNIVLLNSTSSAGKSTIAKAPQQIKEALLNGGPCTAFARLA